MTDMSDIFVGRQKARRGGRWWLLIVIALLVIAGLGFFWLRRPGPAAPRPEPATLVAEPIPPAAPAPALPAAAVASEPAPAPEAAPGATTGAPGEFRRLQQEDRLLDARVKGLELLKEATTPAVRAELEAALGEIHTKLVFSPRMMPEKTEYVVAEGDTLDKLARQFNTTIDAIRKGNDLSGPIIRVGQRLRIFSGRFAVAVDKTANTMVVTLNDAFFKRYRVGTGQYGKTPTGTFHVVDKVAQPTWWRPDGKSIPYGDPENLLGTHWLSLDAPGYGIHGTWEPETIGRQASAGCIRLLNSDVEELFQLIPAGTPVTITE